jgi:hypothetical protein
MVSQETSVPIESLGLREAWDQGDQAQFEYHCYEGHDSADAQLWYRSHQVVTVLFEDESDAWEGSTYDERAEAALPKVYRVRFADGFEGTAWEDELLTSVEHFYRPDPPAPLETA